MSIRLLHPRSQAQWSQARKLVDEYVTSLNLDLSFQNIGHELDNVSSEYGPPKGAFLLAEENGGCVGCVGLRAFDESAGEIKRLYVSPIVRGRGVGRLLAEGIIGEGRQLGYSRLLLDTLPSMNQAQSLYVSLGFRPIEPYRYNPVPGTTFLELSF